MPSVAPGAEHPPPATGSFAEAEVRYPGAGSRCARVVIQAHDEALLIRRCLAAPVKRSVLCDAVLSGLAQIEAFGR